VNVLVIDNYDSFTYNLVQYLGELGAEVEVLRNDAAEAIRSFAQRGTPVLGVCLGHQAMGQAFGGRVVRGEPVHGKTAVVEHDGRTIFEGLPDRIEVGRYHSLVVDPALPEELEVSATGGGVVMGIRHRALPAEGVQFHPESILTPEGKQILRNFLA
jgi:anthranilate synthase/aminodeoxychorismate synthase-like glutamine amidotransferase